MSTKKWLINSWTYVLPRGSGRDRKRTERSQTCRVVRANQVWKEGGREHSERGRERRVSFFFSDAVSMVVGLDRSFVRIGDRSSSGQAAFGLTFVEEWSFYFTSFCTSIVVIAADSNGRRSLGAVAKHFCESSDDGDCHGIELLDRR